MILRLSSALTLFLNAERASILVCGLTMLANRWEHPRTQNPRGVCGSPHPCASGLEPT